MRTFTMYRRAVPTDTHDENQRNAPDEPQFQGVVFDDGRVAVRWLTAKRSTSSWDSLEDMLAIHGHPEYGSELVWHAVPEELAAVELLRRCHSYATAQARIPTDLWAQMDTYLASLEPQSRQGSES